MSEANIGEVSQEVRKLFGTVGDYTHGTLVNNKKSSLCAPHATYPVPEAEIELTSFFIRARPCFLPTQHLAVELVAPRQLPLHWWRRRKFRFSRCRRHQDIVGLHYHSAPPLQKP